MPFYFYLKICDLSYYFRISGQKAQISSQVSSLHTHWYLLAYTLAIFGGARLLTQYSCGETFGPIHIGLKLWQNKVSPFAVRSVSGSGTRFLDYEARDPVPDSEPRLWGLSRSPVVCDMATNKSRDTGPYLHVYHMY